MKRIIVNKEKKSREHKLYPDEDYKVSKVMRKKEDRITEEKNGYLKFTWAKNHKDIK